MNNAVFKVKCLLIICLFTINISGQTNSSDSTCTNTEEANHIFDVYFIYGYGLGYNIYSTENSNIRILLDVLLDHWSTEEDEKRIKNENEEISEDKFKSDRYNDYHKVSLSVHYIFNLYKSKFGELYLGIGPNFAYRWENDEYNYKSQVRNDSHRKDKNEYSLGLISLIGIRSNLTSSISLFVESHLSGGRSWGDEEFKSKDVNDNYNFNYEHSLDSDKNGWYYNLVYTKLGFRFAL